MNNVYTLLQAPSAAARRGAAAGGHLLRCRSSTIYTDIACVAAPCICPPQERRRRDGVRAKVQTLFIDRPFAPGIGKRRPHDRRRLTSRGD